MQICMWSIHVWVALIRDEMYEKVLRTNVISRSHWLMNMWTDLAVYTCNRPLPWTFIESFLVYHLLVITTMI